MKFLYKLFIIAQIIVRTYYIEDQLNFFNKS